MPRATPSAPKLVLIWPGALQAPAGTFGIPQMLNLAEAVRRRTGAQVEIIDLDLELAFGAVDLAARCASADLVGISCYSSFDYLVVMELARRLKAALPRVRLVTGGYHPSARPADFTREGSPFDYVVVGDGELPLARLVESLTSGKRPLTRVLGPEALSSPREVMPYDWSLLDRYRPIARQRASQAEIYLSRGCPYDCSFCMERAKRDTSWRALEPDEAVEELHRLDRYLDLSGWTLRVSDPLFGMKRAWRRAFLEELIRRPVRARKVWLLIRLDLVERLDVELMARANVAAGFGLESGDPEQLRRIRKTGLLSGYLDKMLQVADWAREFQMPFGANIIVGHPGETEQTLRTSAEFMRRLFLDPRGTLGFLAVDPFRLYPGSPIDDQFEDWQRDTGVFAYRYPWWEDGDQAFLAEWIDPSASLSYVRREQLTHELFAPIVSEIRNNYSYRGPAADYFRRALDREAESFSTATRSQRLALHALWSSLLPQGAGRLALSVEAAPAAAHPTGERTDRSEVEVTDLEPRIRVERGPDWARAVFHVLAHVDVGPLPSTLYDPRYVAFCEETLGTASERALGQAADAIARAITSHEEYAVLQRLASLFDSATEALAAVESGASAALETYCARVASGRALLEIVVGELSHWSRLPPLPLDAELLSHLERARLEAPWLGRLEIRHIDSLRLHGRLFGKSIWIGTPCRQLELEPERVARQAAHEATLAEVMALHRGMPERELERLAQDLLSERSRSAQLRAVQPS